MLIHCTVGVRGGLDMKLISTLLWFLVFVTACINGYENIALNKPTNQSMEYNPWTKKFYSGKAVDGLKTNLSFSGGQCTLSANGQKAAWWWVDLTSIQSIHDIRIYYRTENFAWNASNGYTARFLGFSVYISNTTSRSGSHLCFHDTNFSKATIPAVVNITCPVHGRYIIYYNERPQSSHPHANELSTYAQNELCELEVYGCRSVGVFGTNCSITCPDTNCRYCHIETGTCQGCKPGYQGHRCTLPCSPNLYGEFCMEKCGNCSDGVTCNHINGSCANGCDVGVYGDRCKTLCPVGWYGKNCSEKCRNCYRCDRNTGQCTSPCHAGWKGQACNESCDGQMYGQNCSLRCGLCFGYKQCHHINGLCSEGCDAGYKGELCKTVCLNGTFGNNCKENCNADCGIPKTCNRTTGECKGGCQPGWDGLQCTAECNRGRYGQNCNATCGKCKNQEHCDRVNGSCTNGCDPGYTGNKCNKVCDFGYFGYGCREECSKFCKISRECNHKTGFCNGGCKTGWQGDDCFQLQGFKEQNRFHGVLSALCFCLVVIAVLVTVLCLKRQKIETKKMQGGFTEKFSYAQSQTINTCEKTEGNISGEYQELGELAQPSTYESIKKHSS